MNLETGWSTDNETGEISYTLFNVETGEYEGNKYFPQTFGKFRIPSSLTTDKKEEKCFKPLKAEKKELELIAAAIFLFPTLIFFNPAFYVFLVILETILHHWAHKKNKNLNNSFVYFKSPLHVIVKEFCARCREENASDKITKIQDIRNDKLRTYSLEYFKRVVT